MKYRVIVTPNAEAELRSAYRYIRERAPEAARVWLRGVRKTIRSLTDHPERGALAPEGIEFGEPLREVFYGRGNRGTYRIVYVVIENIVFVVHFRHGSRLPAGA